MEEDSFECDLTPSNANMESSKDWKEDRVLMVREESVLWG